MFKRNAENGIWDIICPNCSRYFPATDEEVEIVNQFFFVTICPYCGKRLELVPYLNAESFT